jgi:hypothetical protein
MALPIVTVVLNGETDEDVLDEVAAVLDGGEPMELAGFIGPGNDPVTVRLQVGPAAPAVSEVASASGPSPDRIRLAWHDVTCPEAGQCRDRHLHSLGSNIVNAGVLNRFLDVLNRA